MYSGSGEDLQSDSPRSSRALANIVGHCSPLKSNSSTKCVATKRRARTTSATYTSAGDAVVVRSGTRTIYTAGRPPWYDSHGQLKEPFVIG